MIKIIRNSLVALLLMLVAPSMTLTAAHQERKESTDPGLDLNEGFGIAKTALHCAVIDGNKELTRRLIDAGARLGRLTGERQAVAALHLAVLHSHGSIVVILVQARANIDQKDWRGRTALHLAIEKNQDDIVNYLIFADANVDQLDEARETALVSAARKDHTKIFESLLKAGADPDQVVLNCINSREPSMLGWAIENDRIEMARALINGDANLKLFSCGMPLTCLAVQKERMEILKMLVARNASIEATLLVSGPRPLTIALSKNNRIITVFLINQGADTEYARNYLCKDQSALQSLDYALAIHDRSVRSLALTMLINYLAQPLVSLIADYVLELDPVFEQVLQEDFLQKVE